MSSMLSSFELTRLSKCIAARIGLNYPPERWSDLERGLGSAATECGFADTAEYGRWLLAAPAGINLMETLASHLTIGETYFFRDPACFEVLQTQILPELIRSRRGKNQRLRIWSAGCCTGEEPYSLAITLHELLPDIEDWSITILATDINPRFLKKASLGVYNEWSFRNTRADLKNRYFKRVAAGGWELCDQIKKRVTFAQFNLVKEADGVLFNNTNAMDLIYCRNVLMYFAGEQARKTVRTLHASLAEGGWLLVSPSEACPALFSMFERVSFSAAVFLKKGKCDREQGSIEPRALASQPQVGPRDACLGTQAADIMGEDTIRSMHVNRRPLPGKPGKRTKTRAPSAARPPRKMHGERGGTERPKEDAWVLYEQGRYAEAAELARSLLSQPGAQAKAQALIARIHANWGELAPALQWCEKAIATDRLNPASYYLHAMILQEQGRIEAATHSLQRVLYLDPNFVLAHFALGGLARLQGKTQACGKHFSNTVALLQRYRPEELLPESDGLTVAQLRETVRLFADKEQPE